MDCDHTKENHSVKNDLNRKSTLTVIYSQGFVSFYAFQSFPIEIQFLTPTVAIQSFQMILVIYTDIILKAIRIPCLNYIRDELAQWRGLFIRSINMYTKLW